ncbi:MAG: Trk system potassium transporter TrkA [Deinococcales bacterium]
MNIVIVGGGEIGGLIASALQQDHNVTVLDIDSLQRSHFDNMDVRFVLGSGTDPADLRLADAHKAEAFVACTANDDINVLSCLAAKGLGSKRTLAFVTRQRYLEAFANVGGMQSVGLFIDRILWPQKILAGHIVDIVRVPRALESTSFAGSKIRLVEYKLEADDPFLGETLEVLELPKSILVVGIIRNDEFFIPSGKTMMEEGDKAVFMGTVDSIRVLQGIFSPRQRNLNVAIVGGGNVGFMVAEELQDDRGTHTTIIEQDEKRCEKLSQHLKKTLILQGDGTDLELLEQERIEDADVLVAVTDDDSKNLLVSLLAKQLNIPKIITRVGRAKNRRLFERVGIESSLTPRSAAVQEVLNWLRVDNVDHLASIEDRAEVMEVTYPEGCCLGKIRDLGTPPQSLIGAILRKSQVIIPRGDTEIKPGDHLFIVTTPDNVGAVHEWLEQKRQTLPS